MALLSFSQKDPADVLDYELNFGDWMTAGDSILSATLTAAPSGLTVGGPAVLGPVVRFYLSGGLAGVSYLISATVQTSAGRTAHRSVWLPVRAR